MEDNSPATVLIRRQWNDYRIGEVDFPRLESPHWSTISGGVYARSPQPFIHAYVLCSDVVGDITHSCLHGEGPHRIKVTVLKKDNSREIWERLAGIVGPKPKTA